MHAHVLFLQTSISQRYGSHLGQTIASFGYSMEGQKWYPGVPLLPCRNILCLHCFCGEADRRCTFHIVMRESYFFAYYIVLSQGVVLLCWRVYTVIKTAMSFTPYLSSKKFGRTLEYLTLFFGSQHAVIFVPCYLKIKL